jgi:hypothetical protein
MRPNLPVKKCYTIGYGNYPIDLFIHFLQQVGIDTIVDVRSSPYSQYNPYYNRDNLEKYLSKNQIGYAFMGDRIGGRYSNPSLLFPDGRVNYQKVQNTDHFKEGINQLLSILVSGKKIALMCSEKEPERCHRFALISRVLQSKGVNVFHIRPEIKLQANEDLEKELIKTTLDNRQVSITDEPVNPVESMYEKLNKTIAYKIKDYHQPVDENEVPGYPVHVPAISPDEKKEELPDIQYVSEPGVPSPCLIGIAQRTDSFSEDDLDVIQVNSHANRSVTYPEPPVTIVSRSDSFPEKHIKKPVQKTLF